MPLIIHSNSAWLYDKEYSSSTKRQKPQLLKATDFTHYRFKRAGSKRLFTGSSEPMIVATPNTNAQFVMESCKNAYPSSLVNNKLLEKIKDQTWSAAVDLAELPETFRFLVDSVRYMYRTYRDLRRGKFSSLKKSDLDTLASLWMAWRYAVMPLTYSIKDMCEWWQEPVEEKRKPLIVKTHREIEYNYKRNSDNLNWRLRGKLRGVVMYQVTGDRSALRLGFDPAELPSVLWNVTPYSFIVDWILPIGDALAGLSATNNVEFLDGYVSWRFKSVDCTWPDAVSNALTTRPIHELRAEAAAISSIDYYDRRRLTGFPKPSVRIDPNMNLKRWVDALALLKLSIPKGMKTKQRFI